MHEPEHPHRYFFVHIMKTAGSAFRQRLMNHFGEAAVYPTQGVDGTDPVKLNLSVGHLRERLAARGDQIEVITGHFPLLDGRAARRSVHDPDAAPRPGRAHALLPSTGTAESRPSREMSLEEIADAAGNSPSSRTTT